MKNNSKNQQKNDFPLILALDTSGRKGSLALAQGPTLLETATFTENLKHSANLLPAVQQLLKNHSKNPAEIAHIYISIGPGSFTGLRIATTFAKTLNLARQTKIVTADTLDIIACNINDCRTEIKNFPARFAVVLDAKRNRFYTALFDYDPRISDDSDAMGSPTPHIERASDNMVISSDDFLEKYADPEKTLHLLGEGLLYYKERFSAEGIDFLPEKHWYPSAAHLFRLAYPDARAGLFADPLTLTPNYLRDPDAKPK